MAKASLSRIIRQRILREEVSKVRSVPDARRYFSTEVDVKREIEPLAPEWDELCDRLNAVPFVRPGWIAAWWRAFGVGTLDVLTVRRGTRLAGVLPVCRRHGTLRSPTNCHTPEFGLLAEDREAADELLSTLLTSRRRRVSLAYLDAERARFDRYPAGAEAARYRVLTRTLQRSLYLAIEGDFAGYERGLSRSFRTDLRRSRRRLEEQGQVSIVFSEGDEHLTELLAEVFQVEASGWKGTGGTAITSRPDTKRFYEEVALWAAERGSLRLFFLRLDGRAIAVDYGLEEGGVYYIVKRGYDPAYQRFSPGKLLVHAIIAHAFSVGLTRVEFLGGDEPYKRAWMDAYRERVLFQAFAPSFAGLVEWATIAYGRPLAKRLGADRVRSVLRGGARRGQP